jgi:hypothetical protein
LNRTFLKYVCERFSMPNKLVEHSRIVLIGFLLLSSFDIQNVK